MLSIILMAIGVYGMIACGNYMKKLMCMNIMQVAVIFFFRHFQKISVDLAYVFIIVVAGGDLGFLYIDDTADIDESIWLQLMELL